MVDVLQVPPPAYEQVLTQKLLQCGLRNGHFTVKYEDELQSVEIVIDKQAEASAEHLDCIKQAAGYEIVTFKDPELQQAYQTKMFEALRPKMLADAQKELEKLGIFKNFPERSNFGSDKLFAEALERQCGVRPGSYFVQSGGGMIGQPKMSANTKADRDSMLCISAAVMYVAAKGEKFKFGFIGNEVSGER